MALSKSLCAQTHLRTSLPSRKNLPHKNRKNIIQLGSKTGVQLLHSLLLDHRQQELDFQDLGQVSLVSPRTTTPQLLLQDKPHTEKGLSALPMEFLLFSIEPLPSLSCTCELLRTVRISQLHSLPSEICTH